MDCGNLSGVCYMSPIRRHVNRKKKLNLAVWLNKCIKEAVGGCGVGGRVHHKQAVSYAMSAQCLCRVCM
jgi:hypothetical protein